MFLKPDLSECWVEPNYKTINVGPEKPIKYLCLRMVYSKITRITIYNNHIKLIEGKAPKSLECLSLQANKLTSINMYAFKKRKLRFLYLDNNPLEEIIGIVPPSIEDLRISKTKVKVLHLSEDNNLKYIDAYKTPLKEIKGNISKLYTFRKFDGERLTENEIIRDYLIGSGIYKLPITNTITKETTEPSTRTGDEPELITYHKITKIESESGTCTINKKVTYDESNRKIKSSKKYYYR